MHSTARVRGGISQVSGPVRACRAPQTARLTVCPGVGTRRRAPCIHQARISGSRGPSHSSSDRPVAAEARARSISLSWVAVARSTGCWRPGAWVAGARRGRPQRQPLAGRWRRTRLGDSGRRHRLSRQAASSPTVQQVGTSPLVLGAFLAGVSTIGRARPSRGGLPGRGWSASPSGPAAWERCGHGRTTASLRSKITALWGTPDPRALSRTLWARGETRPTARRRSRSNACRCPSDSGPRLTTRSVLPSEEPELYHADPCLSFGHVLSGASSK
jgi:hypothetical protein